MDAVFVDLEQDIYDRHGIYALSAVLKKHGLSVGYLPVNKENAALRRLQEMRPKYILYSTYSSYFRKYARFDAKIKKNMDCFSVIGGPCITFNPNLLKDTTIDAGCMGEGETALPLLLTGNNKESRNIFLRKDPSPVEFDHFVDLDAMPFPDRDIIYSHDYVRRMNPSKTFISGRGCPFSCTYCFNHRYNKLFKNSGHVLRKKSVDYILEEIRLVRGKYPLKLVIFIDDTFILNKKWLFEFCERFPRELGVPYSCNIRANLMNEDVAKALSESGCVMVNWSIESGNDFFRNTVMKRNMTREQILNTAHLLNKYKINHRIGNVIGLPGEKLEQIFETLELNIAANPTLALANIFVPFPGLEMTRYAQENGYFSEIPEEKLPLNYFSKSVMNIPPDANETIQKIMCLFPVFSSVPAIYKSPNLKKIALGLPKPVLRLIYEIFYVAIFRSIYRMHGGICYTTVTGFRYLKSLIRSLLVE
ncbi:B12-binding domain-containing radical SAM protein [Solidesulfovibrio magneticus]|nr:radical SAM protein [Solidesulfovibrio magneticus]